MIAVVDLIAWAKENAWGRSVTVPDGWIPSELLQNLVYEIKKVEPLHYNPQTDALEKCRTCLYKDAWDEWDGSCEECEDYSEYEPQTEPTSSKMEQVEDEPQTEYKKWETKPTADIPTENTTCVGVAMALVEDDFFREPTAEERKAFADYIDSISVPTGVNVFDFMDEPQAYKPTCNGECRNCEYRAKDGNYCMKTDCAWK